MKMMAFIGSPRKNGNTAKLVKAICHGAQENGHEIEIIHLAELDNKGCIGCNVCQLKKLTTCSINDPMTALLPKIAVADCLIVGTPVYTMQVSGLMKHFLDRLYPFIEHGAQELIIKHLPGKKYITVTCSGAPAPVFMNVTAYLNQLFGFYKMDNAGNLAAGDLTGRDDILKQPEVLEQAEALGRSLVPAPER